MVKLNNLAVKSDEFVHRELARRLLSVGPCGLISALIDSSRHDLLMRRSAAEPCELSQAIGLGREICPGADVSEIGTQRRITKPRNLL